MAKKTLLIRIGLGIAGLASLFFARVIWRSNLTKAISGLIALILIILGVTSIFFATQESKLIHAARSGGGEQIMSAIYYATEQSEGVIYAGPAFLHRIIFGDDNAGGEMKLANSLTRTAGLDPLFTVSGNALMSSLGSVELGIEFTVGLVSTTTEQDMVTFIFTPK